MQGINSQSISRALANSVATGIISEGFAVDKGKGAFMNGAYMGGASLLTDVMGNKNPLADPSNWGPNAQAFSDSIFYVLISMLKPSERNIQDSMQNLLIGLGSSYITSSFMPLSSKLVGAAGGMSDVPTSEGSQARVVRLQTRGGVADSVVRY